MEQTYKYQGLVRYNSSVHAVLTDGEGRTFTTDDLHAQQVLETGFRDFKPVTRDTHPGFQAFLDAYRNIVYFDNDLEDGQFSQEHKLQHVEFIGTTSHTGHGARDRLTPEERSILLDRAYKTPPLPADFVAACTSHFVEGTKSNFAVSSEGLIDLGEVPRRENRRGGLFRLPSGALLGLET